MYKKIINIGFHSQMILSEYKQLRLLNIYALTWIHLSTAYFIIDSIFGSSKIALIAHSVSIGFMLFVLFLNHLKTYLCSKILWLLFAICSLCFYSVKAEPAHYIEYFILFFPASSLCLFTKNTVGYISIPFAVLAFLTPYHFIPVYSPEIVANLGLGFVIGFMMCIFLLVLYFKNENFKNEKLLSLERDKVLSDKMILEYQQSELQELHKFKSHFFVNLSHEIRTPLTLIRGYIEQIDLKKSQQENEEYMEIINHQLNDIKKITDDIIDLSKLDENKIILHKKPQSLNTFIEKLFLDFKILFDQKNIQLHTSKLNLDVEILMDFDLMSRSFGNVLNNALKFTPEYGSVTLSVHHNNQGISVRVLDTGIGIPKSDLHKIFDRFYQSKNDITKSKGSGIGLTFTKNIIETHGFKISVESELNKGTVFTIQFPKNTFTRAGVQYLVMKENSKVVDKTILLVDDHQQMRAYLKKIVHRFNVIEASNGLEAIEILKLKEVDLILTDYMMPVMDGWALVKNIRESNSQIPVFVITARADHKGKADMLRLGIDHYFTKPFCRKELLQCVNEALGYYETLKHENNYSSTKPKTDEDFKNKVQKSLNANIKSHLFGVENLAEILKISSKTLTRKTKLHFGQTPNQLIIEARLLKAKQILDEHPEISLRELTKQIGMKNSSYLKQRFEERFKNS